MPQPKAQSPSDESLDGREVRRRVVKACQRCRLKKCKCDGTNPCTRCKSDDAICAYGKHKKSDKTVFRKGYVQMIERQHTQLIAGLQELYRRIQSGEPFPTLPLEPAYNGQPLTHKILEALGVLHGDEDWEDAEKLELFEGINWQGFEQDGYTTSFYDASSTTTSPVTQTNISLVTVQNAFPKSTIMAKRARKLQNSGSVTSSDGSNQKNFDGGGNDTLAMPPMLNTNLGPPYQAGSLPSSSFQVTQYQQQPLPYFNNGDADSGFGHMDWACGGTEDLFSEHAGLTLQVA